MVLVLVTTRARADVQVVVSQPSPEHELAAGKLVTELRSEGYVVQWVSYPAETPCTRTTATAHAPSASGIWIELGSSGAEPEVTATICYRPPLGALDRARVTAPLDDPQRLAIITVEAVNGLRSAPRPAEMPPRKAAATDGAPLNAWQPRRAQLGVGAATVLDVTGAGPVIGAELRLAVSLDEALAMQAEVFVPALAAREVGVDRTLWLRAAWVRLGLRRRWLLAQAELDASLAVGSALVWARSDPRPPLVGTTALAATALFSAGLGFVYPRESLVDFYVQAHASRLVPDVKLTTDRDHTRPFGALLLDAALGLETRW